MRQDPRQRQAQLLLGRYAASGTYCDMIKSYEMRRDCMSKVVQKQRELSYKIVKKPKSSEQPAE
jgi:hypothetical protein